MFMHLTLLLDHFDFLLVDELLDALKFGEVLFLVLFYEDLQSSLQGCYFTPHLLL